MNRHRVVSVGIDGSDTGRRAMQWAADEAERTHAGLLLVHGFDGGPQGGGVHDEAAGKRLLERAVTNLAERHPGIDVRTQLVAGGVVPALIEVSRSADVLVLGRTRHRVPGVRLGTIAFRVLSHARCPTVVVGAKSAVQNDSVVVGVSDSQGGAAAVRFAFEEAARRGADLVAVRSWSVRNYRRASAAALPFADPQWWESQERTVLEDCLRPCRLTFPSVPVRTALTQAPPESALEAESAVAAMLVLGCRRADDTHMSRLGPLSAWVAHHFDCPVVLVGHS